MWATLHTPRPSLPLCELHPRKLKTGMKPGRWRSIDKNVVLHNLSLVCPSVRDTIGLFPPTMDPENLGVCVCVCTCSL